MHNGHGSPKTAPGLGHMSLSVKWDGGATDHHGRHRPGGSYDCSQQPEAETTQAVEFIQALAGGWGTGSFGQRSWQVGVQLWASPKGGTQQILSCTSLEMPVPGSSVL